VGWHLRLHAAIESDSEVLTAGRAALCSLLATLNDGLVYRGLLSIVGGHYGVAAFGGALLGAIMNFALNRSWTFRGSWKQIHLQAGQYALGALLTYFGLQTTLWLLIERLGIGERAAWFPAKILAFTLISYPFQRLVVFRVLGPKKRWWPT
jgi:putative flippase GtrA